MRVSDRYVVALVVCALAGIGVFGCNTFNGAGKDIQKSGQAVERAATNAQNGKERPNTITASAQPGGSISPAGSTSVSYGSSQTFIATASTGYQVADILVDGRSVGAVADLYHDDSSSYTFNNVAANHVISALFTVNPSR